MCRGPAHDPVDRIARRVQVFHDFQAKNQISPPGPAHLIEDVSDLKLAVGIQRSGHFDGGRARVDTQVLDAGQPPAKSPCDDALSTPEVDHPTRRESLAMLEYPLHEPSDDPPHDRIAGAIFLQVRRAFGLCWLHDGATSS